MSDEIGREAPVLPPRKKRRYAASDPIQDVSPLPATPLIPAPIATPSALPTVPTPAPAVPSQPAPQQPVDNTPPAQAPAPQTKPAQQTKKKGFYFTIETSNRFDAAFVQLADIHGKDRGSKLMEQIVVEWLDRMEQQYNGGQPFVKQNRLPLPTGRAPLS